MPFKYSLLISVCLSEATHRLPRQGMGLCRLGRRTSLKGVMVNDVVHASRCTFLFFYFIFIFFLRVLC